MKRLSRPLSALRDHYDAIVVGSGYGGSVALSRLARMGLEVALLERGPERIAGEFPDSLAKATANFQTHGAVCTGRHQALFDLHVEDDMNVLVGCGLGGTSLINANVAIEADMRVFDDPVWPDSLRDADLATGFARARDMLSPTPYPRNRDGYPELNKLVALEQSAKALGGVITCPPINVTFAADYNSAGVFQPACTLCGDCCSGCNVGAKNTTQMNYLPDGVAFGAEIYCGTRVEWVEKRTGGGWLVRFQPLGKGREAFDAEPLGVSCDRLVIAAGTLGSNEILLRSREYGLPLSDQLGKRFTGNGDVLAFGYNNDQPVDGIGLGHDATGYDWTDSSTRPVGPTIAGVIDLRAGPLDDGMIIEEGAIPGGLADLLPAAFAGGDVLFGQDTDSGDGRAEMARKAETILRGPRHGAVNHTQTFLVMSHDGSDGQLMLEDGRIRIHWPDVGERTHFKAVSDKLREAVAANGGSYIPNPAWSDLMGNALVTVHPLGGCAIADSAEAGVIDTACRVFAGAAGTNVHDGLYVCDGSIMPRSLGVNPLLTISALSERAMIKLATEAALVISTAPAPRQEPTDRASVKAGLRFTERMKGPLHRPADPAATIDGSFVMTIETQDIDRLIDEEAHEATLTGTVTIPALSSEPMTIEQGAWNLFVTAQDRTDARAMVYNAPLTDSAGKAWLFTGRKIVHDDLGFDLWKDTTTLFVQLFEGRDLTSAPAYEGVFEIAPVDFIRQLGTMAPTGPVSAFDKARALGRFGAYFAGSLFDTYAGAFAKPSLFDPNKMRVVRPLRVALPETHFFETGDGKKLRFLRYRGGAKGPLIMAHGLGVSSKIFSIDTIETNLLEFLYVAGFDCWLLDYRASIELPYAREAFCADDVALKDYPAAVSFVRARTGAATVQFLGHCYGAMSLAMALLAGLEGVRCAVISQIAAHAHVPFFPQRLLAFCHAPDLMKFVGVKGLDACATVDRVALATAIDTGLAYLYPFRRDDRTHSATSRRITALYGQLYQLDQLNQATLDALPEMFGISNIHAFQQLALIARKAHVVGKDGTERYLTDGNLRNFAMPTLFVHGALNRAFLPSGTIKTREALSAANGKELYERVEIPGTGHIDCMFGKNAAHDVYPHILRHLLDTA